jgi:hypothetical protein
MIIYAKDKSQELKLRQIEDKQHSFIHLNSIMNAGESIEEGRKTL